MNDMQDWTKQNEEVLRRVLPQTQRLDRHVPSTLNHEELENELEDEDEYLIEGKALVTRRVLIAQVKKDSVVQHGNIFCTLCHVNNKVSSLIIYGGSYATIANALLVEKVQLPKLKHPKPYKLQWLNDSVEVKVQK